MSDSLFISARTVVIGLLQADKRDFVDLDRIEQLCDYLWSRVRTDTCFERYQSIVFDAGSNAIARMVQIELDIFDLVGNRIYLKVDPKNLSLQPGLDPNVLQIISDFVAENPRR